MKTLEIWTVYRHPIDHPDKYVVRKFLYDQPTEEFYTSNTLEGIRKHVPKGLYRLSRQRGDDPKIVETWF